VDPRIVSKREHLEFIVKAVKRGGIEPPMGLRPEQSFCQLFSHLPLYSGLESNHLPELTF
jgi:hypothetical protein